MKIVSLTAENYKRLRAVHITPDGNVVVVAGRNAQGKSSVLDSIWAALAGAAGAKDTPQPIRDGEDRASVTLDLGELRVTRTWHGDKTTLKVESADGAVHKSPQTMLDSLIGRLSFDPLAFAQQDEKAQRRTLMDLLGLDFADADAERLGVFEHRTNINRDVKRLDAQLDGLPPITPGTPDVEVDVAALTTRISDGLAVEQRRVSLSQRYSDLKAEHDRRLERVAELRRQADEIEADVTANRATLEEFRREAQSLVVPDVTGLREQLTGAETTNRAVRAAADRRRLQTERAIMAGEAAALTERILNLDDAKQHLIAAAMADAPVAGLSFDDDGVTYQSVPFRQCSAAERLRVSVAMAMVMNPTIRVIRITDGSLLDRENLALIEQMADAHDFQIWLERVDETGTVGVVIEDGEVATPADRPRLAAVQS